MAKTANLAPVNWVFVLLLFILAGVSQAQTAFYVDANYAGGTRNGSASNPWKSLYDSGANPSPWSAINSALASADVTVYFSARQPSSNTPEVSTTALGVGNRTNTSSHMLTLDGISQYNTNTGSPSWAANVTPSPCSGPSCPWFSASKFTIQANTPIAGTDSASNCQGFFTVQGFSFQATEGQSADLTYTHDLTFQYNEVTRIKTGSYGPGLYVGPGNQGACQPISSGGPDNVSILYNYIHATWGECIYAGASSPDPPGNAGNVNTGKNYLIQGNTIESCASWGGQGDGTDFKDGHANGRIIGNTYHTTKACSNCGSQSPGNDGQGITTESGTLIDGNYIERPYHQGVSITSAWNNTAGRGDITVRNNIIVDVNGNNMGWQGSNTGIHLWSPTVGATWGSFHAYNNTIFNTDDVCIQVDSGNASGLATVENNICSNTAGGGLVGASSTIGVHDYNQYYNVGTPTISAGGSANCPSISGSEAHSSCSNPQFVSTSTPYADVNFKLQTGSAAIGSGVAINPTFLDYFGDSHGTNWSMGMAESGTASAGGPNPATGLAVTSVQ